MSSICRPACLQKWLAHLLLLLGFHVMRASSVTFQRKRVDINYSLINEGLLTDISSSSLLQCAMKVASINNDFVYNEADEKCRLINIEPTSCFRGVSTEGWSGWTIQVNAKPCPEPYFLVGGVGCVYLETINRVVYADIANVCMLGGKPVSPPTDEAFALLRVHLMALGAPASSPMFLGIHPKDGTGIYKWYDGHTITTASPVWPSTEPNNDGNCLLISYYYSFHLSDGSCTIPRGTVCHLGKIA